MKTPTTTQSRANKKTITVDFDQTLVDSECRLHGSVWVSTGTFKPIPRVCDFVRQKSEEGCDIHIVTFRTKETSGSEVEDFVKKHKLPIKGIHYTGMQPKTNWLKNLESELHVDDDIQTCLLASMAGIEVLLVDHGQHKKDKTAKLFKRI